MKLAASRFCSSGLARGGDGRGGGAVVLCQDQQVGEVHRAVAGEVAVGPLGGGGLAVVLGQHEQVGEIDLPVAVGVAGQSAAAEELELGDVPVPAVGREVAD